MDVIVERLAAVPLFASLTDEQRHRVSRVCERVFIAPGKTLVDQGATADAAYLCLDDMIISECRRDEADAPEITAVPAGSIILELAMIVETEAAARFAAEGHARAVRISRDRMLALLETDPALAQALNDALLARLADMAHVMRETMALLDETGEAAADGPAPAERPDEDPPAERESA